MRRTLGEGLPHKGCAWMMGSAILIALLYVIVGVMLSAMMPYLRLPPVVVKALSLIFEPIFVTLTGRW